METLNVINELDKLVVHHFNKEKPFEIADIIVPVSFLRGSPDTLAISKIWSNVQDIKYPVLVVSRDSSLRVMSERNTMQTEGTQIIINRIAKNKYISSGEPNINVETYTYNAPVYFSTKYSLILFCESMKHATEFQSLFLDRINQEYLEIKSEKFNSVFFDALFLFKDGFKIEDNFESTSESKRIIKVSASMDCEGYYISQASEVRVREVSKKVLQAYLRS